MAGTEVVLPPDVPTGQPWTLRLQLFPDGTCGVAVNGVALARSDPGLAREPPHRVVLWGNSLDTEILVGEVEVWEGVRGDVDWRQVPVS